MTYIRMSIEETVHKLFALSQSDNEHEAAAALAAAHKLIQQHRLTSEEFGLHVVRPGRDKPEVFDTEPIMSGNRIPKWKVTLLAALARRNGCKLVIFGKSDEKQYIAIGRPSDVDIMRNLFQRTSHELARLATKHCKKKGAKYRNQWLFGAIEAIKGKLTHVDHENQQALVLIDNRLLEADAAMRFHFRIKKRRISTTIDNREAFGNGKDAGQDITL